MFFFNLRKNKKISTQPSMQTFLPLRKKHFHVFFLYHDTQFFETGPRLSNISEISIINNTIWLSILSNENLKPKWILGIKVFSHCNKNCRCIFHLSQFLHKNICNICDVEISGIFTCFNQKLQSLKSKSAVNFYCFLAEYQISICSRFFFFGPGLVF